MISSVFDEFRFLVLDIVMKMRFSQACSYIGVGRTTMYRLIDQGHIKPFRSPGGHYVFDSEMLDDYLGKPKAAARRTVCYCRVSTRKRKQDLERQIQVCELFCAGKGWDFEVIEDIGSGMNFKKPGLVRLVRMLLKGEISRLIVTHKDRLLRFGVELIELICEENQTEFICINKSEERNAQEELAEDILSIITVFSGRLYGSRSRKHKKIIEENRKLFGKEKGDESEEDDPDGNGPPDAESDTDSGQDVLRMDHCL